MNLLMSDRSRINLSLSESFLGTVNSRDWNIRRFALSITLFCFSSLINLSRAAVVFCRSLFSLGGLCFQDHPRPLRISPSWAAPCQALRKRKSLAPTGTNGKSLFLVLIFVEFGGARGFEILLGLFPKCHFLFLIGALACSWCPVVTCGVISRTIRGSFLV